MSQVLASAVLLLVLAVICLQWLRYADLRQDKNTWRKLAGTAASTGETFAADSVAMLPELVRRYFLFTIRSGTPLCTTSFIRMQGELGTGSPPGYLPMRARQVLAPPRGLVWVVNAGSGLRRLSGSDGMDAALSWSRFWLLFTIPVARAGGTADHRRSAFGRVVAEALFWAPAAMLPSDSVRWEQLGNDVARATVTHDDLVQAVDLTVGEDGRPISVELARWSNANPAREFQWQPFGGTVSDFRDFSGYRLPTRVEGGNFFGTDKYVPFYRARVDDIQFAW